MLKSESDFVSLLVSTLHFHPNARKAFFEKLGLSDYPGFGENHKEIQVDNTRPDIVVEFADQRLIIEAKKPQIRPEMGQLLSYVEKFSLLTPVKQIVATWLVGKTVSRDTEKYLEELMRKLPQHRFQVVYWEDILAIFKEFLPSEIVTKVLERALIQQSVAVEDDNPRLKLDLSKVAHGLNNVNAAMSILTFLDGVSILIQKEGLMIDNMRIDSEISPRHYPYKESDIVEKCGHEQFSFQMYPDKERFFIKKIEWGLKSDVGIYIEVRSEHEELYRLKEIDSSWRYTPRNRGGLLSKTLGADDVEKILSGAKTSDDVIARFRREIQRMINQIYSVLSTDEYRTAGAPKAKERLRGRTDYISVEEKLRELPEEVAAKMKQVIVGIGGLPKNPALHEKCFTVITGNAYFSWDTSGKVANGMFRNLLRVNDGDYKIIIPDVTNDVRKVKLSPFFNLLEEIGFVSEEAERAQTHYCLDCLVPFDIDKLTDTLVKIKKIV